MSPKGISTKDVSEVLKLLFGEQAGGMSANKIFRPKDQWSTDYPEWHRRDQSEKHDDYLWKEGVYVNVWLEDEASARKCILLLIGATAEGMKDLIAVVDGFRESEQNW